MMRSFLLFMLASALVVGCGVVPPDRTSVPTRSKKPTIIMVRMASPQWRSSTDSSALEHASGENIVAVTNGPAWIGFIVAPGSVEGRRRCIDRIRKGVEKTCLVSGPVRTHDRTGVVTWRFATRSTSWYSEPLILRGTVREGPSNLPGYGIAAIGFWPALEDHAVFPQFLWMARHAELR